MSVTLLTASSLQLSSVADMNCPSTWRTTDLDLGQSRNPRRRHRVLSSARQLGLMRLNSDDCRSFHLEPQSPKRV